MDTWYGMMLIRCHGDVRSVYRRFKDGYKGTVHRWFIWYGISMVFRVWFIVGVYGMVHS